MYRPQFFRGGGPPRTLGLVLILFVVLGGVAVVVWYAARGTPTVDPAERTNWKRVR